MKKAPQKIPDLPLLHHDQPVDFVCKTMQQIEEEQNDQLQYPHRHSYYTIIWIEKAEGIHHIDFKRYNIENNSIYFIGPEQVHHLEMKSKPKGYVLLFTTDFLEANGIPLNFLSGLELFFACDEVMPIKLKKEHIPEIKNYVTNIFIEFNRDEYLKEESLGTWLKLFLITCRRMKAENGSINQPVSTTGAKIVKEFKTLLEKHYKQLHKVSDYAALMFLTSNYLNEVIKAETGQSPKDFIQNRIILEAKRLAIYSEHSLKEIAYKLGFEDPAHFSKFFKNCTLLDFSSFKDQFRKKYL